ncbi:hypothetical protein D918_06141 [Trichuris suis]|nr:hypothetical protein D918_06141 [Trichuris suis]
MFPYLYTSLLPRCLTYQFDRDGTNDKSAAKFQLTGTQISEDILLLLRNYDFENSAAIDSGIRGVNAEGLRWCFTFFSSTNI